MLNTLGYLKAWHPEDLDELAVSLGTKAENLDHEAQARSNNILYILFGKIKPYELKPYTIEDGKHQL